MLRLRANIPIRCPKHPNFNPHTQGEPNIRGNCIYCLELVRLKGEFQTMVNKALEAQERFMSLARTMNKVGNGKKKEKTQLRSFRPGRTAFGIPNL
jgi:hypothetical protein